LLGEAGTEMDFTKRKADYVKFQKIVVHDLPILFIAPIPYRTIYDRNLANIPTNIWGMMSPLDKVYWKVRPKQ
jgi:peptide/nickel transport system substrate-binding protein